VLAAQQTKLGELVERGRVGCGVHRCCCCGGRRDRPTPPRRRLTAPIPPDSATGPALALPSLRRPSTTAVFPSASSPRSTMGAPH